MARDIQAWHASASLDHDLELLPWETAEQARTFVRFALRCLRETPTGNGRTPESLLTDQRACRAVEVVAGWLDGRAAAQQLAQAEGQVDEAAAELTRAGIRPRKAAGGNAACYAVRALVEAASAAAQVRHLAPGMVATADADVDDADAAAAAAIASAAYSRQAADDGKYGETIHFQRSLIQEVWPTAV